VHNKNIIEVSGLKAFQTIQGFLIVQKEGKVKIKRNMENHNLSIQNLNSTT